MTGFIDQEIWEKIHNCIAKNPGLHLTKIAEMLKINISSVEWYLVTMVEKGELTVSKDDGYIRYFVNEKTHVTYDDRRTQETRKKIIDIIKNNPGLHMSKIAQALKMSRQLAEYHLLYLEKNNMVSGVKENGGYYKRFFIKDGSVGIKDKQILALLRQEVLLKIVLILWKKQNLIHKELVGKLDISPATLTYHLNKLIQNDIINVTSYGKERGYTLKNEKDIIWMVRKYKLDRVYDYFKDMWEDLSL